ncbi:hypothetical protein, partial [Shewanella surugensis]
MKRSHKITLIVLISLFYSQNQARYVETITPLIQDELGEQSLIDMRDQLNHIRAQYAELAKAINERETIIANEVRRFEGFCRKQHQCFMIQASLFMFTPMTLNFSGRHYPSAIIM